MANLTDPLTYRLGYPAVDRDHEKLSAVIGKLEKAVTAHESWQTLARMTLEVQAVVESHFENEEGLMQAAGYQGFASHKAEHEKTTAELMKITRSMRAGDAIAARDLVFLLKKHLDEHTLETDGLMVNYLLAHEPVSQPGHAAR
jgi:hemerythrin